eukprot:7795486-Ditylum_brightwellii.AAC.1
MATLKVEACKWIYDLEESLSNLFLTKEMEKITTCSGITCSYKAVVSENAKEAATAYKKYFKIQNDPITIEDDLIVNKEDQLEKCWQEPPRSVYSQTATTANATVSSVSGLTASTNQTLQDIFQQTKAVKIAYQNKKVSLQQMHNTTMALQTDTTTQDNLAMLCKQTGCHFKKKQTNLKPGKNCLTQHRKSSLKNRKRK